MYCIHCGSPVPEFAKFCPSCGGALSETTATSKIRDTAEWSSLGSGSELSTDDWRIPINHLVLQSSETTEDWVGKWNDTSKEFLVDKYYCGANHRTHYILMNQVSRIGDVENVGFKGHYFFQDTLLYGDVCDEYIAVVSKELGSKYSFLFEAGFDDTYNLGMIPGNINLSKITYQKQLDDEYYSIIQLERLYLYDWKDRGILKKTRYYFNFRPSWGTQFFPTEKYNREHNTNLGNKIIPVEEWMSKFGSVFWGDVDRYQKELTSFLGMDVYSFFEAYNIDKELDRRCIVDTVVP